MAAQPELFWALQLELAGALGVGAGRYVLRAGPADPIEAVLVISEAAGVTTLTLIEPQPLPEAQAGERRLVQLRGEQELTAARPQLARVFAAARLASRGRLYPPGARALRALRAGYGSGPELAQGVLGRAKELSLPRDDEGSLLGFLRPGSPRRLSVQQRFAAVLGGRIEPLRCEELALRARGELEDGEPALAALDLELAVQLALRELGGERTAGSRLQAALEQLERQAQEVADLAALALAGAEVPKEQLEQPLRRLEAVLARRAIALESGYKKRDGPHS